MSSEARKEAHVVVVGAGAIGSALLPLLATLQVDSLTIIDGDTIERSNLVRQPLYGPADVGRYKVDVAKDRLHAIAPEMEVIAMRVFLDSGSGPDLLSGSTLVVDCTDDIHARRTIDGICGSFGLPLVTGSVFGTQLQVMTLYASGAQRGLKSFYPGRPAQEQDGCDMRNVPVMVTHMAATLMAWRMDACLRSEGVDAAHMDVLDIRQGLWLRIAPPAVVGEDPELIASTEPLIPRT